MFSWLFLFWSEGGGNVFCLLYSRELFGDSMFSYILYGVIWAVSYLPFWLLYGVADLNYVLLYHVARYRRRVVRENLRRSFPEKDAREIRRIERRYYRHMADLSVETYKLWHMSEREIRRRCVFDVRHPLSFRGHSRGQEGRFADNRTLPVGGTAVFGRIYRGPDAQPVESKLLDRVLASRHSRAAGDREDCHEVQFASGVGADEKSEARVLRSGVRGRVRPSQGIGNR